MCAIYKYTILTGLLMCGPLVALTQSFLEPPVYQATLGQFPYQVDLKSIPSHDDKNYTVYCGGALIGANKVLTLPNCLVIGGIGLKEDRNDSKRFIDVTGTYVVAATLRRVETFEENKDSQWRQIASILLSKDLVLAIAYTDKSFILNEYVGTIPYASKHMEGNYEQCVLAGYSVRVGDGKFDNLTYGNLTAIPEEEFSVVDVDPKKTLYAKYEPGARGYPGSALVCFNTSDPNEGASGVLVGICIGNEFSTGESDYVRVSHYNDFVNNTATHTQEIVCYYCLLVTLCQNLFTFEF